MWWAAIRLATEAPVTDHQSGQRSSAPAAGVERALHAGIAGVRQPAPGLGTGAGIRRWQERQAQGSHRGRQKLAVLLHKLWLTDQVYEAKTQIPRKELP